MKKLFTLFVLLIVLFCTIQVSAQYSTTSLSGPWFGLNFDPDAYMIFDGNGNVNEFGAFGGVSNSNIGTYSVTSSGNLSCNLHIGAETFSMSGQFITTDSISFGDNVHYLLKIPDAGALSGTWSGGITNSSYGSLTITVNSSGLITSPNTWTGHVFVRKGKAVGFFETRDGSNCWHQIQLVNCVYANNTITGKVTSDCKDLPVSTITLSRSTPSNANMNSINGLTIYPNPTNGIFKIEGLNADQKNKVSIYTIDGRLILSRICNSTNEMIDISEHLPGMYLLFINEKAFKIVKNY
jgi:hypothetical protein